MASDWPRTFLQPGCFCLASAITEIFKYPGKQYQIEPLKGLRLSTPLNVSKHVYRSNEAVYKLYDKEDICDKEKERIEMGISYLQPERQDLSKDGCFYMLSYNFIKQKARELQSSKDYIAIMTLEQLHDHDHVHSDLWELNLLFPQNTNEAMLIDFDLMGTVNTISQWLQQGT